MLSPSRASFAMRYIAVSGNRLTLEFAGCIIKGRLLGKEGSRMAKIDAPYAPGSNIAVALKAYRTGDLPTPPANEDLVRLGIPKGNAPRVVPTLKFLGLLDQVGRPTPTFEHLRVIPDENMPNALADVIKQAYAPVFRDLPVVSGASTDALTQVFGRHYGLEGQRERQVSLFRRLCVMAGLMSEEAPIRKPKAAITHGPTVISPPVETASQGAYEQGVTERKEREQVEQGVNSSDSRYRSLFSHVGELPQDGKWTKDKRDRWLNALAAMLDWSTDIVEPERQVAVNNHAQMPIRDGAVAESGDKLEV